VTLQQIVVGIYQTNQKHLQITILTGWKWVTN
jgi:hypothetical protein